MSIKIYYRWCKMGIRITGFDTPFGGISWEYTEKERKGIQNLFFFLESKRILVNPDSMEVKQWCIESALEIRQKLVDFLAQYHFPDATVTCIRSMITACNDFLDQLSTVDAHGILYKNHNGDWENSTFSSAMKQFRTTFRDNIHWLSTAYNLPFDKVIPEQY